MIVLSLLLLAAWTIFHAIRFVAAVREYRRGRAQHDWRGACMVFDAQRRHGKAVADARSWGRAA